MWAFLIVFNFFQRQKKLFSVNVWCPVAILTTVFLKMYLRSMIHNISQQNFFFFNTPFIVLFLLHCFNNYFYKLSMSFIISRDYLFIFVWMLFTKMNPHTTRNIVSCKKTNTAKFHNLLKCWNRKQWMSEHEPHRSSTSDHLPTT